MGHQFHRIGGASKLLSTFSGVCDQRAVIKTYLGKSLDPVLERETQRLVYFLLAFFFFASFNVMGIIFRRSANGRRNVALSIWVVLILTLTCMFYITARSLTPRKQSTDGVGVPLPFLSPSHRSSIDINGGNMKTLVGDDKRTVYTGPNPLHNR